MCKVNMATLFHIKHVRINISTKTHQAFQIETEARIYWVLQKGPGKIIRVMKWLCLSNF